MNKRRTLLFVGAHPDDETFGIGGTLAQYAAVGVRVYYACATRGEVGTADAESMKGFNSVGDMRWAELECAARVLGLAGVVHLGYRDSGMAGSPDNRHPESLAMAPLEQAAGRVVRAIREFKPEVVITHDPLGGYRHPDHIAAHRATVAAFEAAGDSSKYVNAGAVFAPQKLYFNVFPRGWLKLAVKLLPLLGQNPRRFGRNHDIDIASLAQTEFPVHARVRLDKRSVAIRAEATACYKSQMGGGPPRRGLFRLINTFSIQQDSYMRACPEVKGYLRENDLFAGVI
ncbi:MAG: GlcNAc-PI de-N-acetylase [Dehalococcoidia bacterium]|nr:MAG: GlcNAc-PI de-N-acetylase [Dehalococcoidia bacterium]